MTDIAEPILHEYATHITHGLAAGFDPDSKDYIRAEHRNDDVHIYWSSELGAVAFTGFIAETLPPATDVEVWHPCRKGSFDGADKTGIITDIDSEETIRLEYFYEMGSVGPNDTIVSWRVLTSRHQGLYRLSAVFFNTEGATPELDTLRTLILDTATSGVTTRPLLVDKILAELSRT